MIITAKANHKPEQLTDRVNKGFKEIELQLTGDFMKAERNLNDYLNNILKTDGKKNELIHGWIKHHLGR